MKNLKIIIVVFTLIMGLMGCDKEEESSTVAESKIYFRWTEDLNTAVCPTIVANGYSDNNNDVPDNAAKNNYYGPCKAGTYQAQFNFGTPGSQLTSSFTYTLTSPPAGYKRYYSKRLCGYSSAVNRCLNYSLEDNIVFKDEKL